MEAIYQAVGPEAVAVGASDDDRMDEVRKRMLAAARLQARETPRPKPPGQCVCVPMWTAGIGVAGPRAKGSSERTTVEIDNGRTAPR